MLILHHQRKAKKIRSAGKVTAYVFWDAKGILFIDDLPTDQTITGQYYANLMDQLQQKIRAKKLALSKKKIKTKILNNSRNYLTIRKSEHFPLHDTTHIQPVHVLCKRSYCVRNPMT